jgi:hypothetical protein
MTPPDLTARARKIVSAWHYVIVNQGYGPVLSPDSLLGLENAIAYELEVGVCEAELALCLRCGAFNPSLDENECETRVDDPVGAPCGGKLVRLYYRSE